MGKWEKSPKGKAYRKQWLATNKGRFYQAQQEWVRRRDLLYFYLKNKPCVDCYGRFEPCQMQFDHVRGQKIKIISQLRRGAVKTMLEEVKKCDVVCANCHALRTYRRKCNGAKAYLSWDFGRDFLQTRARTNEARMQEQVFL